eukprot:TRINITY_DN996_c0_g3_i1.p1 TRINITY_DN996_c0_g3~~TRINITY_DN996_c0_g3_i1.p1  ORF type:complete len:382 (+),score=154.88 TRINITY_DN996_c0_g3_i1:48-1148(+)
MLRTAANNVNIINLPKSMKAIEIIASNHSLRLLNNIRLPQFRSNNDVLIKVNCSSLNPLDSLVRYGYGNRSIRLIAQNSNQPLIVGRDFSGIVVKTAPNAWQFKIGDQVYGAVHPLSQGSHAEFVVVSQDQIALKPKNLNFIQAASIPFVALTTYQALNSIINSTSNVFVFGGAGGIGSFAIQWLKSKGCTVWSNCSQHNIDLVRSLGADCIFDRNASPNEIINAARNCTINVVFDPIGTIETQNLAKNLLAPYGYYVTLRPPLISSIDQSGIICGTIGAAKSYIFSNLDFLREKRAKVVWGLFKEEIENTNILSNLANLFEKQIICTNIDSIYNDGFQTYEQAYTRLQSGLSHGKIVMQFDNLRD